MKEYPSIPKATQFKDFVGYTFDKMDGQNIRVEFSKKKGWTKFGSRHQLIDETSSQFKNVFPLFHETMSDALAKLAKDNKWDTVIYFMEYWGSESLGGIHGVSDKMQLTLFDIAPHKQGILGPKQFLNLTSKNYIYSATYLGNYNWTKGFIEKVYNGEISGVTLEGVVGKAGDGHSLIMAKAKTKKWLDLIKSRYTEQEAERLINS